MFKFAIMGVLAITAPGIVEAARWEGVADGYVMSSTGLVTTSEGDVLADYPDVGSPAQILWWFGEWAGNDVDRDATLASLEQSELPIWFYASLSDDDGYPFEAGVWSGELTWIDSIHTSENSVSFSTSDISVFDGTSPISETLYGGVTVSFASPLSAAPVTWGEFLDAAMAGGTVAFSFNGTVDEEYVQFGASVGDAPDLAPVPLPASALLMLGGLGGLAALRRRGTGEKAA